MASKTSFRFGFSEILLIIFLAFSGVMLAFHSGGFVLNFKSLGFTVLSSVQKGVSAVTNGIDDTIGAIHELARLREENRELTEKLKNYEILQRANTDIKKENDRLKEQLDFSVAYEEKNYPAQIISRNPDSLYSAFTINKGSRHGVRKNMPVLAVQGGIVGLVGKVVTVGAGTEMLCLGADSEHARHRACDGRRLCRFTAQYVLHQKAGFERASDWRPNCDERRGRKLHWRYSDWLDF